jgi:hypothetical protein
MNATRATDGAYNLVTLNVSAMAASPNPSPSVEPTPSPVSNPTPTPITASPTPSLNSAPTVSTGKLSGGRVGQAYTATLEGRDSNLGDTLTLSANNVPAGLSITNCTQVVNRDKKEISCTLSGTPTQAGSFTIQVKVSDNIGTFGTRDLKLDIR